MFQNKTTTTISTEPGDYSEEPPAVVLDKTKAGTEARETSSQPRLQEELQARGETPSENGEKPSAAVRQTAHGEL